MTRYKYNEENTIQNNLNKVWEDDEAIGYEVPESEQDKFNEMFKDNDITLLKITYDDLMSKKSFNTKLNKLVSRLEKRITLIGYHPFSINGIKLPLNDVLYLIVPNSKFNTLKEHLFERIGIEIKTQIKAFKRMAHLKDLKDSYCLYNIDNLVERLAIDFDLGGK
jgi:hypothetical protein